MLPIAPSPPPTDTSTEPVDVDNGVPLIMNPGTHHTFVLTSTGVGNMGAEPLEASSAMDDHEDSDEDSDDDHDDMSDGGAMLTSITSHNQALNEELDLLDAELMGEDNLMEMLHPTLLAQDIEDDLELDFPIGLSAPANGYHSTLEDMDFMGELEEDVVYQEDQLGAAASDLQATAVAQQLQHLQDGQGHVGIMNDEDGTFNNSTAPFPFSTVGPVGSNNGTGAPVEIQYVSLANISPSNVTLVAPPVNLPNFAGIWTSPIHMNGQPHPFPTLLGNGENADDDEVDDQFNLSFGEFLTHWAHRPADDRRGKGPSRIEVEKQRDVDPPKPCKRSDLQGERCDFQRINWSDLGVSRFEARQKRRETYRNYQNLRTIPQWHPRLNGAQLRDDEDFFRFRRMDFYHQVNLSHFQLRHLMSCASRDHVFYSGRNKIMQWNPTDGNPGNKKIVMDLSNPTVQPPHALSGGIQISTLTARHNILVAGGFNGEYALVNLRAHKDTKHTEGIITEHINSITNHVQVYQSRLSGSPQVAFASNDHGVRILDVASNKFAANHQYDHAINCTAISPDRRLRVMVGDTCQVMIANAETGEILQSLEGHRDFGFACDWADNGWTVATGNQDKQIMIWDARKWTRTSGIACPVTTIAADQAGVRSLKFSPLGSGKRILAVAEPADIVNLIDAETFASKQTLDFFGEIGGMDFSNAGRDLLVANADSMRGGMMEYERCDYASASLYDVEDEERSSMRNRRGKTGYDWMLTDEETTDHPSSQGTLESRLRQAPMLFHE